MAFDLSKTVAAAEEELEESSSLPLIRILQGNTPQAQAHMKEYIPGAAPGQFLFNATQEAVPGPLEIIPVGFRACYAEWKPKSAGGGLVAHHPLSVVNDPLYEKGRDPKKPYLEYLGDNDLVRTSYWCVLVLKDEEWQNAIIAMSSSQLTVARKWSKDLKRFKYEGPLAKFAAPMFAQKWQLGTALEENAKGDRYFNYTLKALAVLDPKADSSVLELAYSASQTAKAELPAPAQQAALPAGNTVDGELEEDAF
jgi:hypothetical protein